MTSDIVWGTVCLFLVILCLLEAELIRELRNEILEIHRQAEQKRSWESWMKE